MNTIDTLRNIGIMAHIDAGKTTTTERILFYTGINYKIGEVHEGLASMDWMEQEKSRGITITSAATKCKWTVNDIEYTINLIDTPGHVDFTMEVERSLRVLDGAIAVFDGVAGVEPQTETVWLQANKHNVPRICFVNKLDRMGANYQKCIDMIQSRLSSTPIVIQIPVGKESNFNGIIDLISMKQYTWDDPTDTYGTKYRVIDIDDEHIDLAKEKRNELVELAVSADDNILEKYLEDPNSIDSEDIYKCIKIGTLERMFFPVLCGSAFKNKGVQLLLDAVTYFLPSPHESKEIVGISRKTKENITLKLIDDEPFVALAFKIMIDPHMGKLTYLRVYSGRLKNGMQVNNNTLNKKERISKLYLMHANHKEDINEVTSGNIVAVVGLKYTKTGDTLSEFNTDIVLESIEPPKTVISISIETTKKVEQEKLSYAINRLADEDPSFNVRIDHETGQTIVSGMGELHLEIIVDRIRKEYNVDITTGKPQVAYRESIRKSVKGIDYIHKKQTGGAGQFARVIINIEPHDSYEFIDKIVGGHIPKEYIPAVGQGCLDALTTGVAFGFPMIGAKVTLVDGQYHDVDSSELAFKIAGSMAFKMGVRQASPYVLEPIMRVVVVVPNTYMGDTIGNINGRRGIIESITSIDADRSEIVASVPLSEMFGYVSTLRSQTQGRGSYTMSFNKYAAMPKSVQEELFKTDTN